MPQMKEEIKTSEKELSNEEIANLSDAQFKTLVSRMLTELVEYSCKIEEKVKAMQSERKLYRQPTVKGRKPGLKSTIWNREGRKTFNHNRMKKQEFKK